VRILAGVKPGTDKLLARAARALSVAERALGGGAADIAAARAYGAMIAAAKALLNEKGLRLVSHAAVAAAFEKHAGADVGEGRAARLREVLARRERGGREDVATSFEDARVMVERAREFVAAVAARLAA
jgi:uncharacterized protein (UPF0332 family)